MVAATSCKSAGSGAWPTRCRRSIGVQTLAEIASQVLELASLFHDTIFELTAGVGRPLVRDKFAFGPGVFHRVSAVDAELGIGLGVRFP